MVRKNRKKNDAPSHCVNFTCPIEQNTSRDITDGECCNFDSTEVFEGGKMVRKNRKKNDAPSQCVNFTCNTKLDISRDVTEGECCDLSTTEVFDSVTGKMVKKNIKKNPAPSQCVIFTCVDKSRNPTVNDCVDSSYASKVNQNTPFCMQNPNQTKGGPVLQRYIANVWKYSNSNLGKTICPDKIVNIPTQTKC